MGILRTNTVSGIGSDGPIFDGVTKFDTQGYVVPPTGTTDQRSAGITTAQGTIRFNTDSQKLEFYAQDQWWEMVIDTPDLGVSSNTGAGARGLFGGGYTPATPTGKTNTIDYITISSTGNAIDFGDLQSEKAILQSLASNTRGIWAGGRITINVIDYVTISSTGNAQDFGDLSQGREDPAGVSNGTRGVFGGGGQHPGISPLTAVVNTIDYITIASTGNAVDYGDLTQARRHHGSCASPVRGIFAGGYAPISVNTIDYITTSTLGNATDFGDLTIPNYGTSGCSNATRGLFSIGNNGPATNNTINYITISTLGNAIKFGELPTMQYAAGGCASPTRGVWGGGTTPLYLNTISYVTISSQSNSVDFGDLNLPRTHLGACSNAHGGL